MEPERTRREFPTFPTFEDKVFLDAAGDTSILGCDYVNAELLRRTQG